MPPNIDDNFPSLQESQEEEDNDDGLTSELPLKDGKKLSIPHFLIRQMYEDLLQLDYSKVLWSRVIYYAWVHIFGLIGLYKVLTLQFYWQSFVFAVIVGYAAGISWSLGSHRLWCHRAFKARWPLKAILVPLITLGASETVYDFSYQHRSHHKYTETDADHTDSRRGFFFAHIGWKLYEYHPKTLEAFTKMDIRDILADPFVMFQHNYYPFLLLTFNYGLIPFVPYYFFGEDFFTSFVTAGCLRFCVNMHGGWSVASFAHYFGYKPYDKHIRPSDNPYLALYSVGEGWHNYHHSFPSDYRSSEINGPMYNLTTNIIEFLAKIGLVYDLKTASKEHIESKSQKHGRAKDRIAKNKLYTS